MQASLVTTWPRAAWSRSVSSEDLSRWIRVYNPGRTILLIKNQKLKTKPWTLNPSPRVPFHAFPWVLKKNRAVQIWWPRSDGQDHRSSPIWFVSLEAGTLLGQARAFWQNINLSISVLGSVRSYWYEHACSSSNNVSIPTSHFIKKYSISYDNCELVRLLTSPRPIQLCWVSSMSNHMPMPSSHETNLHLIVSKD